MKKITESQLKDRVNSLREYLKVYEVGTVQRPPAQPTPAQPAAADDPNEIPFDPTWGGTKAPADTRAWYQKLNPFGDGPPQAANKNATWNNQLQAAVSNQPKAPPDLANMDIGFGPGKYAPDTNQAASVTPTAPAAQNVTAAVTAKPDPAKLAQFKDLLAKAGVYAAPAAASAPPQSPYALQAAGAKLKANEGTTYFLNKLRLIESRQLNEGLTDEESKQLDRLFGEFSVDFKDDPELAPLFAAYQKVPSVSAAAPADNTTASQYPGGVFAPTPAQAAAVRPPVAADPRDGAVGKALAALGVSKQDRLNQEFVNSTLGAGKFKAGTAEANMALQAHFKQQAGGQNASVTAVTPPTKPTKPTAPELTQAQQNLKNAGYPIPGTEMRTPDEITASAGLADVTPNINAGLTPDDPRFTNPDGTKGPKAPQGASVTPKKPFKPYPKNSRYDLEDKAKAAAAQPKVTAESVGYNELQRIVSLVNYR